MTDQRNEPTAPQSATQSPPPRAFTQGVGTVFQFVGVILFLVAMFACCGSALLSKDTATRADLTRVGWHLSGDAFDRPTYSAQRATSIGMVAAVFLGIALAGLGLGLQAQHRLSPIGAVIVTGFAAIFWIVQTIFFVQILHSVVLAILCGVSAILFAILLGLSVSALREMRRDPPPLGQELLPPGYKIPYSHLHEDPPEVRLARELDQRRQRLAVQQKELEMLEDKLRKKLDQKEEQS